jgi:hypothetical protein
MRGLLTLILVIAPQIAPAQGLEEAARGRYGSARDPLSSCAANPHELGFLASPPHLVLTWDQPRTEGGPQREVYDLEGPLAGGFLLRQEGSYHADPAAEGPYWVLQLTRNPEGYCWRRPDWPQVRCEDQQLRCEAATS